MRGLLTACGNLLLLASLAGCLLLAWQVFGPPAASDNSAPGGRAAPRAGQAEVAGQPGGAPDHTSVLADGVRQPKPISRVIVPEIGLDADVVTAQLVERDGGMTWEIPAFKVGHAESTAAAGEPGNAVLLGHVSSLHAGNVFKDLERVRVSNVVELISDDQRFEYRVTDVRSVPRTETSLLQPTDTPTATLITCTGLWLPTLRDYTERLVVRAALASTLEGPGE